MIFKKWVKNFSEFYFFNFIDDLWYGIQKLNFKDNFESYTSEDLDLSSGVEAEITHNLGSIPSGRIIIKQDANATFIDSEWTKQTVKITASADCKISIVYFL